MFWLALLLFIVFVALGVYKSLVFQKKGSYGTEFAGFAFGKGIPFYIAGFLILTLGLSFTTVDAGTRAVVTRWGQVNRSLDPGPHFLIPFAESTHEVNVQTRAVKPKEDSASADQQMVTTEVTMTYHYDPAFVDYIYSQQHGDPTDAVIVPAVLEAIKSSTAHYSAADLIAKRPTVKDEIDAYVVKKLQNYHIVVEMISITDFHYSKEYEQAIEAKVTAVQKAEQATNDLNRIQIEAQQKIAAAKGEAEALSLQKQQITPELLQLRTIEMMDKKWDGHLPENYYGGAAPLPIVEAFKKH